MKKSTTFTLIALGAVAAGIVWIYYRQKNKISAPAALPAGPSAATGIPALNFDSFLNANSSSIPNTSAFTTQVNQTAASANLSEGVNLTPGVNNPLLLPSSINAAGNVTDEFLGNPLDASGP